MFSVMQRNISHHSCSGRRCLPAPHRLHISMYAVLPMMAHFSDLLPSHACISLSLFRTLTSETTGPFPPTAKAPPPSMCSSTSYGTLEQPRW